VTKDEIAKLPTPETDANTWVRAAPKQSSSRVEMVQAKLSRSLEQRLAAAMLECEAMSRTLQRIATSQKAERHFEYTTGIANVAHERARETRPWTDGPTSCEFARARVSAET